MLAGLSRCTDTLAGLSRCTGFAYPCCHDALLVWLWDTGNSQQRYVCLVLLLLGRVAEVVVL